MRAVLLAAGLGTRLAPLTESTPKILAPVLGKPLLAHQLDYLALNGVSEVAINLHHHAPQVLRFLDERDSGLPVQTSVEPELLGTAGALLPLRDFLREPFVLLYGDVLTNMNLGALMSRHLEAGGMATVAYYPTHQTEGKGLLTLERDGRVTSFREKPRRDSVDAVELVNAGIYALDPDVFEFIPGRSDFGNDVWPAAISAGRSIYGHQVDGFVCDIGSPQALRNAEAILTTQEAAAW